MEVGPEENDGVIPAEKHIRGREVVDLAGNKTRSAQLESRLE